MNTPATTTRYSKASIGLHWLMLIMLIVLVAVYACMELSGFFPKGSDTRALLKTWHYMLGLSVFVLVWIRLAVKLTGHAPPMEPTPVWQGRLAHLLIRPCEVRIYLSVRSELVEGFPCASKASTSSARTEN